MTKTKQQKQRHLFCWIGAHDLRASEGNGDLGPIAQLLSSDGENFTFDDIHLLCNYGADKGKAYVRWLTAELKKKRKKPKIHCYYRELSSPTNYEEIYTTVLEIIEKCKPSTIDMSFHVSPGTPAMAAVWIILAKAKYSATIVESSKEKGAQVVSFPFDITAEYRPVYSSTPKFKQNVACDSEQVVAGAAFDAIVGTSTIMQKARFRAKQIGHYDQPTLIEGESGTGKELFAKAIHSESLQGGQGKPFKALNCGAIPENLVESELFGSAKHAYSGAIDRVGYFEEASGGTLFLDEIGELPLLAQTKLLRVLQEREVQRLGETEKRPINVRVIAATNKDLMEEVQKGTFRLDLLFRIAVTTLKIPPLRERKDDIVPLIEFFLNRMNTEYEDKISCYTKKTLSNAALERLKDHSWPGNVRELEHTLVRLIIFSAEEEIQEGDVTEALLSFDTSVLAGDTQRLSSDEIKSLPSDISQGVDITKILNDIEKEYIQKALDFTDDNNNAASKLLGYNNYQTLSSRRKKFAI